MKVLMFIAPKTQRAEFITAYDVFLRAGLEVSIVGQAEIIKNDESSLVGNNLLEKDFSNYSAVVFPGGRGGVEVVKNLFMDVEQDNKPKELGNELIRYFNSGKLVAAICAAPTILGGLGLLKNKNFTCYPGFEGNHFGGNYRRETVVKDNNLITGRSMYYTADFALEIVEYLLGKEERNRVERQIKGIQ